MRNPLSNGQRAFYKCSSTNPNQKKYLSHNQYQNPADPLPPPFAAFTLGLAACRSPTRPRLSLHPITVYPLYVYVFSVRIPCAYPLLLHVVHVYVLSYGYAPSTCMSPLCVYTLWTHFVYVPSVCMSTLLWIPYACLLIWMLFMCVSPIYVLSVRIPWISPPCICYIYVPSWLCLSVCMFLRADASNVCMSVPCVRPLQVYSVRTSPHMPASPMYVAL